MRTTIAGLLMMVAAACAPAGARQISPDAGIAITRVTVVDVVGGRSIADQTVLVAGERIVRVGGADEVRVPRGARVVDGAGKYLIPGLWDMHAHAANYGDTASHAALTISLAHGVTGLRDMGAQSTEQALRWRDDIAAGRMLGPRMKVASPIVEHPRWLTTVIGWEEEAGKNTDGLRARFGPTSTAEVERWVDSVARLGVDHIKVRNWPDTAVSRALVARARERRIPVVAHANRPFPDVGVASYEHSIFPSLNRTDAGRDSLFRQWAASGVAFVPTLVASIGHAYHGHAAGPRRSLA